MANKVGILHLMGKSYAGGIKRKTAKRLSISFNDSDLKKIDKVIEQTLPDLDRNKFIREVVMHYVIEGKVAL